MRWRGVLGVLGAGVLLAGLVGCASGGSAGGGGSPSPSPTSGPAAGSAAPGSGNGLDGHSFVATEVTGSHALAPNSTITITFDAGRLSANAGCNTMAGGYTVSGDKLTAPQLASTMMACDEALMAQDTWLSQFLASGPTFTLAGDTLTLTNGTDTLVLGPAPSGAAVLESTGWRVTDVITRTASANTTAAVDPSLTAWLRFKGNEVAFNNSCNVGGGPVEIGATTMTFGALRSTLIFCDGPSGQLEQTMSAVLQGTATYSISSSGGVQFLTITSADGANGIGMTADPSVGQDAFTGASPSPGEATSTQVTNSS